MRASRCAGWHGPFSPARRSGAVRCDLRHASTGSRAMCDQSIGSRRRRASVKADRAVRTGLLRLPACGRTAAGPRDSLLPIRRTCEARADVSASGSSFGAAGKVLLCEWSTIRRSNAVATSETRARRAGVAASERPHAQAGHSGEAPGRPEASRGAPTRMPGAYTSVGRPAGDAQVQCPHGRGPSVRRLRL